MPSRLQARYHVARASYAGAGTGPEAGAIGRQRPGRGGGNGGQSRTSALVVFVAAPFGLAMRSCRHSFPDDPFEPLACGQSLFSSCWSYSRRRCHSLSGLSDASKAYDFLITHLAQPARFWYKP